MEVLECSLAILARCGMSRAQFFHSYPEDGPPLLWKAWAYESPLEEVGGSVTWELRRLLEHCQEQFPKGCGRYLVDRKPTMTVYFTSCGVDIEKDVLPSLASWTFHSSISSVPAWVKKEFQVGTRGLLAFLFYSMHKKRSLSRRALGRVVFTSLLSRLIQQQNVANFIADVGLLNMPADVLAKCCMRYPRCAQCVHVSRAMRDFSEISSIKHWLGALILMLESADECVSWTEWVPVLIERIRVEIEGCIQNVAVAGIEELDARDVIMVAEGGKKRRVDEDLLDSILGKRMKEGQARTVGALVRTMPGIAESTVGSHVPAYMGDYRAALTLELRRATSLSISFDATRVGCPKEDVLSVAVMNPCSASAGWLAPQVLGIYYGAYVGLLGRLSGA